MPGHKLAGLQGPVSPMQHLPCIPSEAKFTESLLPAHVIHEGMHTAQQQEPCTKTYQVLGQ